MKVWVNLSIDRMKTALVTDSTSDIPLTLANLYDVCIVPAVLVIDGKSYDDGEEISREEFYERLPAMITPPTTAAPPSGKFQQCYEKLLKNEADQILSIHASGKLSGIINSAQAAAYQYGDRVRILDSGQVSLGLGFQVIVAAQAALNDLPLEQIITKVKNTRHCIRVVALLDTLEYLKRSGRVSWTRAALGSLLQIKPIIELSNGEVYRLGEARTRKKGIERLTKFLLDSVPISHLALVHTNAEQDAINLLDAIQLKLDAEPLIVHATTVIGTHVGPKGLGFIVIKKNEKQKDVI